MVTLDCLMCAVMGRMVDHLNGLGITAPGLGSNCNSRFLKLSSSASELEDLPEQILQAIAEDDVTLHRTHPQNVKKGRRPKHVTEEYFNWHRCVECCECGNNHERPWPFKVLFLDMAEATTIPKALSQFLHKEVLAWEEPYRGVCKVCFKTPHPRTNVQKIRGPRIMVIQLSRMSEDRNWSSIKTVNLDLDLDLGPCKVHDIGFKGETRYRLTGVVQHHGLSVISNSFSALVRDTDGHWNAVGFKKMHKVEDEKVCQGQPHLLIYSRIDVGLLQQSGMAPVQHATKQEAKAADELEAHSTVVEATTAAEQDLQSSAMQTGGEVLLPMDAAMQTGGEVPLPLGATMAKDEMEKNEGQHLVLAVASPPSPQCSCSAIKIIAGSRKHKLEDPDGTSNASSASSSSMAAHTRDTHKIPRKA
ncbi:hypothetical protein Vafri_21367 [Volvox africanus]|uniref:ubiquitinyl hydrolase 1 n=1 Tax=Volvox africanus TaxID=51714 RepID=A0A8J4BT03_9CHLO|nr:hypothetical protein Vafri_21367 [Volvox africanus]